MTSRSKTLKTVNLKYMGNSRRVQASETARPSHWKHCYQCDAKVAYLFADGRCNKCTRVMPEEV